MAQANTKPTHTLLSASLTKLSTPLKHGKIVVFKSKRVSQLFDGVTLVREYPIALGSNPVGYKSIEGDRDTPESEYYINHKNPKSQFYLSLGIGYHNIQDAQAALTDIVSTKRNIAKSSQRIKTKPAHRKKPPWMANHDSW